jgi:hypothetical protein
MADNGRWVQLSVGEDPHDAAARRLRKEAELNALNNGASVVPENGNGHPSVASVVARFLEEGELTKKVFATQPFASVTSLIVDGPRRRTKNARSRFLRSW